MKRLLPLVLLMGGSATWAYDPVELLLSDHAVICSPTTPGSVAAHLTETWGALILAPRGEILWQNKALAEHVAVALPALPSDPKEAVDSVVAWKDRWGLSLAIVSMGDRRLTDAAAAAGLQVYRQTSAFRPGRVAVPSGAGYEFYAGPEQAFFSEPGYLHRLRTSRAGDAGRAGSTVDQELADMADQLAAVFDQAVEPDSGRWQMLLKTAQSADRLSLQSVTANSEADLYARRWRTLLSWWLAPTLVAGSLPVFTGIETAHTLELASAAEVPLAITDIQLDPEHAGATWNTEFPLSLEPGVSTHVAGSFRGKTGPGRHTWPVEITCEFDTFRFTHWQGMPVTETPPLRARFNPPILFADRDNTRNDADFSVHVAVGRLQLENLTSVSMILAIEWQAEDPIKLSATQTEVTLDQGEETNLSYTLSIPKDLKYKEYDYGVTLVETSGYEFQADGHLWRSAPKLDGQATVGVVGVNDSWRRALQALGLDATLSSTGEFQTSELSGFGALVIQGGVAPPGREATRAVADFVESGHIVIVDIDPEALQWTPWDIPTVRRPGPFAASFYNEDLAWWAKPNGLVGGCFAAASRDSILTLPAGIQDWDPLLVDDDGKGFMYRRRLGRGWFVAVHTGWTERLTRLERRALLGLLNLVSTRDL